MTLLTDTHTHSEFVLKQRNTRWGRIFILGTGPSLLEQLPLLHKLKNEATFVCNTFFQWKEAPFVPTYYGISDIYDQHDINILADLIPSDVTAFNVQWEGYYNNPRFHYVCKAHDSQQVRGVGFVGLEETLPTVPTGRTTPLTLAQIAAWMGYREFYFLGCEQTRGYCHEPDAVVSGASRRRHEFPLDKNPKYRIAVRDCARRMRADVEAQGGRVYDCSPGGVMNSTGNQIHTGLPPVKPSLEYRDLKEVLG
jgi:hypothetical protein